MSSKRDGQGKRPELENRWIVYTYSGVKGQAERSTFRLLKDADAAAVDFIENAESPQRAAIVHDGQKQQLKHVYGNFPIDIMIAIKEGRL